MIQDRSILKQALSKAQAVAVQNVMNPLLWLNAVAIPMLLGAAYFFSADELLSRVFGISASVIPLWTLREYGCWRRDDPGRLHSERYLIRHQQLTIQSKNQPVPIVASSLPAGENPEGGPGELDPIAPRLASSESLKDNRDD